MAGQRPCGFGVDLPPLPTWPPQQIPRVPAGTRARSLRNIVAEDDINKVNIPAIGEFQLKPEISRNRLVVQIGLIPAAGSDRKLEILSGGQVRRGILGHSGVVLLTDLANRLGVHGGLTYYRVKEGERDNVWHPYLPRRRGT
jgi:hypothetical protein